VQGVAIRPRPAPQLPRLYFDTQDVQCNRFQSRARALPGVLGCCLKGDG
jgi:hypothetical protein